MSRDFYESVIGRPDPTDGDFVVLGGVRISVFNRGTTDLVTIYQRETGVTQGPSPECGATGGPNPFLTGSGHDVDLGHPTGSIQFWADAPGRYDILVEDTIVPARIGPRTIPWNAIPIDGIPESSLAQAVLDIVVPVGGQLPYTGDGDPPGGRFLLADGRFVLQADYPVYTVRTGHKYNGGVDPGGGRIKLPDKRGRGSLGADNMGTAQGPAGRLSSLNATQRSAGQGVGLDQIQLTAAQIPAHIHPDNIVDAAGGNHNHGAGTGYANPDHVHTVSDPGHYHVVQPDAPLYNTGYGANGQILVANGSVYTGGGGYYLPRQVLGTDSRGTGVSLYSVTSTYGYAAMNHNHTIADSGTHTHVRSGGVLANTGGDGTHSNIQPSEVDNWIVRMK